MLSKELIEKLYGAANSQRWNDHLRPPQGFTELDKQAHKMIIAYVLAKHEEDREAAINWRALIEGGLFEFLHRTVVTDIKPPVFYELMRDSGQILNEWVINQMNPLLNGLGSDFPFAFSEYFTNPAYSFYEKRILKAAHYLATNWEFRIIYRMNKDVVVGIEDTREEIRAQIEEYRDLAGVQALSLDTGQTQKFIDLVGQLRFQKRWAQSPRIPETSVMGHMLIVAIFGYFCARILGASDARLVNNYLCGLFHDLPEVLTRDIISPVKRAASSIEEKIKQIECVYMRDKIFPLIPAGWHDELRYFTENEFETKIWKKDGIEILNDYVIPEELDKQELMPVDGRILKCCDNLAALIEAVLSYKHGVFSQHLLEGITNINNNIYGRDEKPDKIDGIDFDGLLAQFAVADIIKSQTNEPMAK